MWTTSWPRGRSNRIERDRACSLMGGSRPFSQRFLTHCPTMYAMTQGDPGYRPRSGFGEKPVLLLQNVLSGFGAPTGWENERTPTKSPRSLNTGTLTDLLPDGVR